jgi:hypothetical protein
MVGEMMPITGSRYLRQAANSKEDHISACVQGWQLVPGCVSKLLTTMACCRYFLEDFTIKVVSTHAVLQWQILVGNRPQHACSKKALMIKPHCSSE